MELAAPLRPATFLRRLSRFAAVVHLAGQERVVHLPNSGRLHELLTAGRPALVAVAPRERAGREQRTAGVLVFMLGPSSWVSVDARLPGALLAEAVAGGVALEGLRVRQREWVVPEEPRTRLDLLLEGPAGTVLVETKSVTLVRNGRALFPDAPTERGRRHLDVLRRAVERGGRAAVAFVVQRPDVERFEPHREADPAFARALARAVEGGVFALAFACEVRPPSIRIARPIAVAI